MACTSRPYAYQYQPLHEAATTVAKDAAAVSFHGELVSVAVVVEELANLCG